MHKMPKFVLCLLSAVLLTIGWPPLPTAFLLFVGFVPLLLIHSKLKTAKYRHLKFFLWTYLALFIFNTGTTWWVWNASASGCIIMLFANSLIMSLPFLAFSYTESKWKKGGYTSLILYYLTFEFIHFNWSASWPWLTLGKGLATMPEYIQWYEYTGELGGSLLILLLNVMVFKRIHQKQYIRLWQPAVVIVGMWAISLIVSFNYRLFEKTMYAKVTNKYTCVISQPNIDPYQEKFSDGNNYLTPDVQLKLGIDVARPYLTKETDLLLFPETAITGWNDEARINEMYIMQPIKELTDSTGLTIIAGAETFGIYNNKERPTITARFDESSQTWWDSYNTSLLIANGHVDSFYHKSKLVPGVEKMPFAFLEKLSINLGGASGSLASSDRPINFIVNKDLKIAPLVCYESVFGDYVADFVRDGATALAVITNDGWWGETPGYQQHLLFGAIRCIETRKEMLRSANTGVSAKINVLGDITHQTKYKERVAFECEVLPNTIQTFYVRYGNIIGYAACILAGLFLLATFTKVILKK